MADLNKESMAIWKALKPMIDEEIKAQTRGSVQRRKMKVTTAPSLVTNVIGVTEPYGTEMLIPFNTNLSAANVGDVVWVEFMYGATNAFASMYASADTKDFTVGGVLDVVQRRCSASLSAAGLYSVMNYTQTTAAYNQGATGAEIVFHISRRRTNAGEETHEVKMMCVYDDVSFVEELSKTLSGYQRIDKIRYTYDSNGGHVDIHASNTAPAVSVDFDVYCEPDRRSMYTAASLESVNDAPTGETILTTYDFTDNGTVVGNLTSTGVLDVTQRRCSATLSSAGWYRVLDVSPLTSAMAQGALGESIRFDISRRGSSADAETHTIVYRAVNGGNGRFTDESSKSGSLLIDKIRYTRTANSAHIDIHYNSSGSNGVTVYFDVNVVPDAQYRFTANSLTSVADAPSGETVQITHEFMANTDGKGSISIGSDGKAVYGDAYSYLYKRNGIVYVRAYCVTKSISSGGWRTLATIPAGFRPPISHDFAGINNGNDTAIHARITAGGELNVWPTANIGDGTSVILETSYITNA